MNLFAVLQSSVGLGLLYALMTLGLYISYRILNVADLTVDGSFTLGAAVSGMVTLAGYPFLGVVLAACAGAVAGAVTAFLQTKLKVQPILAGILTMTALYSVNIMVMGGSPSLSLRMGDTLFGKARGALGAYTIHVIGFIVVMLISIVIFLFLNSQTGLTIRATGDNEDMVKASSINIDRTKMIGLALANALVGVSGALLAQAQGYVDAGMGIGMVVIGLASLIIGEVVCGKNTIVRHILAVIIGSIIYRFIIGVAIEINLSAYAMKIVSALIVVVAISFPTIKEKISVAKKRGV
jgi:putative ABC transport system permease protein